MADSRSPAAASFQPTRPHHNKAHGRRQKCDGHVDEREREAILGRAGELEPDEVAYIEGLLAGPTDLDAFVRRVPPGMAEQVYAFSLMAVELELPAEFEYFGRLARALGLDEQTVGTIHDSLGQPRISL